MGAGARKRSRLTPSSVAEARAFRPRARTLARAWGGAAALALLLAGTALASFGCGPRPVAVALAVLPSELGAVRAVVDEYAARNGTRIHLVAQQYPEIRRALAAEAAGGGGALDLVELDVYSLALAKDDVAVLDAAALAPVVDALEPETLAAGTLDGLRFLPFRVSWEALIYDATVLDHPPATWDELLAVARAHPGKIGLKGARYEGLTCDVLPFVWGAGGSATRFDDPGAQAAFRFLAELAPYLHPHSATFKEASIAEAMARGELVVQLNWPFAMHLYASEGLAPQRFRSAPIPAGPVTRATVLGGGYLGVPRNAPHRQAALALLGFLLSRDVQQRFARELGWFSARRDVAMASSDELLAGYRESRSFARPRPERADYPEISRLWQEAFRAVAFGGEDPDEALRAAARAMRGGS
jgi:ABC-type glycerol-3-phosphate transport system substrate-binding protein